MIRRGTVLVLLVGCLLAITLPTVQVQSQVAITQWHWMDSKWHIPGPEGRSYWAMGYDFYQPGAGWVDEPAYFELKYELYDDPEFLKTRENGTIIKPLCQLATFERWEPPDEPVWADAYCKEGYRVFIPYVIDWNYMR